MRVLTSELDQSVNFIQEREPGMLEARYVRREDDYFIVYLSSQTGCDKACRFCHLTQTGQTKFIDATLMDYTSQVEQVFDHYLTAAKPAKIVHFNFMARGEVFANQLILDGMGDELIRRLNKKATDYQLLPKVNFSTIMPRELEDIELANLFPSYNPNIYYSLYSTDPAFRKRWLPKALPAEQALEKLSAYQQVSKKIPVLHWAFIKGKNDDQKTIEDICQSINQVGLRVDFNIVRYNPYSDKQGCEPELEIIERNAQLLAEGVPGSKVNVVDRVGFDVYASCGTFPESKTLLQIQ